LKLAANANSVSLTRGFIIVRWFVAVVAGLALGSLSAVALAGLIPSFGGLAGGKTAVDGWNADFTVGSAAADPYTRARVARHGLLALARSEAVYFVRDRDDSGAPLTETCRYRLTGSTMPAHWWSVTLYDSESRLPMNDDVALSIDASRMGDGEWSVIIASQAPPEGHWVSSRAGGDFDLTLRLYLPDDRLFADPASVLQPPRVERLDCAEGAL
jgi:hypothetical protein